MTDTIGFNYTPGSGLTAPLFSFEVNSGGQYSGTTRLILFGHKTAAGTAAMLTPRPIASQNDADGACGPGSMLREMVRVTLLNAPVQPIWVVPLPEVGTVESRTITIGALPGTGVGVVTINGTETLQIPIGATDTPTTVAAALAAALNAYYNPQTNAMLPFTAQAAAAVVTLTMRHAGAIMSDTDIYVPTTSSNNLFAVTGVFTATITAAGAGVPVVAAGFAALADDPADFVVNPWSDTVSLQSGTTWANDTSGRWAFSRQSYGHVWSPFTGSFSSAVTLGLTLNDRHTTLVFRPTGTPTPSWLWVAAYCARHAPWLSDCVTGNVSRNQTGNVVQGVTPPRDRTTWPAYPARNTLLNSGLSTWTVGPDGSVAIDKCVTTYRIGTSGQPDTVFQSIQRMYQASGGLGAMRATLAQEQGQKSLMKVNPGGLASVTTTTDITGSFIHAYTQLWRAGVFDDPATFTQGVVARQDSANPARVNVYAPIEGVNPLDIIAANATFYSAYPAS